MKVNKENKRIKAVKSRFVFFPHECCHCRDEFYFEKMWKVTRWTINDRTHDWFYCRKCMPTAESVLHEVDTDSSWYGIAFVDPHRISKTKIKPHPPRCESMVEVPK